MDIYRILENFNAASREPLNEGPIGAIAGGLAGAALTKSPSVAMAGASMGDSITDEALHHICETHRAACEHFVKGGDLDSELFDALHNHYLSRGEMPFGIAKMRDGHPKDWCAQKLAEHLGLEECGTGMSMGAGDYAPMAESTNSIRRLAGLEESTDTADVEEGNDFTQARKDAIAAGKTSFKCGGKTYKVTGDTSDEKKQVKEGAKPDFLDMDKDGDKKEPMKKAVADKKAGPQKGVNPFAKKDSKVDEAAKQTMSRAAKGYEKYGKAGMQALAKAGREGRALDPVRSKYDKYDESVESDDKKECPPMSHIKKMCQDGKTVAEICKMHPDCDRTELKQMVADCKKNLEEATKPAFPGSPEYEKKYGKVKHDDDSAFHKKKVSTGTVYSRKHKEEPEVDDEDDTPKKKGRPAGTKKKIGAKGPSTTSKLIKDGPKKAPSKVKKKVKEGMDIEDQGEYDDEAGMARQDLHTVVDAAKELHDILASDENLPEWVQAKITKALDYIDTSRDYVKSSHADQGEEEIDEAAGQQFKKGDPVTYGKNQMIFYAYDPQNPDYVYLQSPGQTSTQAAALSGVKPAQKAQQAQQFKKGDKVVANGAPAIVYNIDAANNTAYVQYEADLAKGSPQTAAVVLNQLKPVGVAEAGYSAKAARAGKDIGKPGKNFAKIAKSSGGGEKGQRIAGAVLNKLRHHTEESATPDQLDQQKMSQMKRAAATRTNSRNVQQQPPLGGPRRSDIPAGIRKARSDAPLGRDEMGETSMGGTVAGGIAPAAGQKTFAEASSGSHEVAWKAAGKAVHAIMKKRGYTGSKTEQGYMWTKQTPRGTAFVDIDFDERDPDTARWGEGELKGAKNKSYYQSGNDNVSDLAQVIGELFANVKLGQPAVDEADEDGKPNFAKKDGKHKPDDDGDGVPDWADKKPGADDNEESDDSKESDDESDDDKELKLMKSRAGVKDKDDSDDKESDDDSEDDDSDNKPKKGKKPDFGKKKDNDSDDSDDEEPDDKDDSEEKSEKKDSGDSEEKSKDKSGTPYGKSVYESAFKKSLKTQLRESVNMNTSQDDTGKKSVTVTATDEDADKLGELLKMAGLFSSQGYSSVCQGCGGVHEAGACGHNNDSYGEVEVEVAEDLANSPDEHYSDENTMLNTLSGGLNGRKSTGQSTGHVVNRQDSRQGLAGEVQKVQEAARNRLWKLYGDMSSK